ncbi:Ubiquitin-protein ligase protein [Thalictrum thalictroides]|uniref:Ubiquitin-protein ligase protein n=1 Tax=Thalictrum thalictroides TaxID=46969 RepID=A0A7J6UWY5_THATH|nr:Ubiquitin-protein ligase protein [Thalictrum thalictroides]
MNGNGGGVVDWSKIPEDVLVLILKRLPTICDAFGLAQVCKSWASIVLSPYNISLPKPPFLMLSESNIEEEEEKDVDTSIPRRGFIGINNSKCYKLHLPELHQNRNILSTGNWLAFINMELEISILNLFSKTQIPLPSQYTLPDQWPMEFEEDYTLYHVRNGFIKKIVLSTPPKSQSNNSHIDLDGVVAMVIFGSQRQLAIARPGDKSWVPVQTQIPAVAAVDNVIFFNNRFYSVNCRGKVAFYDIDCNPPQATLVLGDFKDACSVEKYYLVEWLGELLLVAKYCDILDDEPYYDTVKFEVYKLDFDNLAWEEVKSLGQHSLFLGFNTSRSLLASDSTSTFRRNCIYFTDDNSMHYIGVGVEGGHDMGVFDLEDGTITPHYTGKSTSFHSPPLWIIPNSLSHSL